MEDFLQSYFGSLSSIFFSILYMAIALPLVYRKIKRNNFYGFRITYTMQDDDIWYEVNAMLGRHMVFQGIIFGIIGLAAVFFKGTMAQALALGAAMTVLIIGIIYSLMRGIELMNRMAVEKGLKK